MMRIAIYAVLFSLVSTVFGAEPASVLPGSPTTQPESSALLGPKFESLAAGIALSPPADCKVNRYPTANPLVSFVNEKKQWTLVVKRLTLNGPLFLATESDPTHKTKEGMLEQLAGQYRANNPSAEFLRKDLSTFGKTEVGMIAFRSSKALGKSLTQCAILRGDNFSDRVFFVLEFVSPSSADKKIEGDDPQEVAAVQTFSAVLESVKVLDRTMIKVDQDARLLRTRALFATLSEPRLRKVLIPQQWFRIIRDGRDLGYTYNVEEIGKRDGMEGLLIGVTSRMFPAAKEQVDAESWFFTTFDRKHETFTNIARIINRKDEKHPEIDYSSEIGSSDRRTKVKAVPADQRITTGNRGNRSVYETEQYTLHVTGVGKFSNAGEPVDRDLPPFYLPEALGHLLPRLVPVNEPKTYLVATYVTAMREVMFRYIEVGNETSTTLNGQRINAIPINDHIGLEGAVTTHYFSPDGKFLGSYTPETKTTILPSDAATLKQLWKNPDLKRPAMPKAEETLPPVE